eukprot:scaffold6554_cov28-Tisochrysis_lutea.AAC.2
MPKEEPINAAGAEDLSGSGWAKVAAGGVHTFTRREGYATSGDDCETHRAPMLSLDETRGATLALGRTIR